MRETSLMRHWKNVKNIISFSFVEAKVRQVFLIEFNYFSSFFFFLHLLFLLLLSHDDEEMHLRSPPQQPLDAHSRLLAHPTVVLYLFFFFLCRVPHSTVVSCLRAVMDVELKDGKLKPFIRLGMHTKGEPEQM